MHRVQRAIHDLRRRGVKPWQLLQAVVAMELYARSDVYMRLPQCAEDVLLAQMVLDLAPLDADALAIL